MSTQLATIEQYFEFRGEVMPPELSEAEALELNALLKRASNRIRSLLRRARLTWGSDGFPKNGSVAQSIAEATVAQASFLRETNNVDGAAGAKGYDSVSMDGVAYAKRGSTVARDERDANGRVAPEVAEILSTLPIWSTRVNGR